MVTVGGGREACLPACLPLPLPPYLHPTLPPPYTHLIFSPYPLPPPPHHHLYLPTCLPSFHPAALPAATTALPTTCNTLHYCTFYACHLMLPVCLLFSHCMPYPTCLPALPAYMPLPCPSILPPYACPQQQHTCLPHACNTCLIVGWWWFGFWVGLAWCVSH